MSNVIMSPYYCCVLVMFLVPCPVNGACAASDVWPVQTCTLLAVDLIFAHSKFIVPWMDGCYLKESNLQIQVRKELQNAGEVYLACFCLAHPALWMWFLHLQHQVILKKNDLKKHFGMCCQYIGWSGTCNAVAFRT